MYAERVLQEDNYTFVLIPNQNQTYTVNPKTRPNSICAAGSSSGEQRTSEGKIPGLFLRRPCRWYNSWMDDRELFAQRRERFMDRMDGGVAIFAAAPRQIRNHDVEHEYRQDSDFYYLTGFEEPESICVLAPESKDTRFTLFVLPRDKERETWTGIRAGVEGASATTASTGPPPSMRPKRSCPRYCSSLPSVLRPGQIPGERREDTGDSEFASPMYRVGIHPPPRSSIRPTFFGKCGCSTRPGSGVPAAGD